MKLSVMCYYTVKLYVQNERIIVTLLLSIPQRSVCQMVYIFQVEYVLS